MHQSSAESQPAAAAASDIPSSSSSSLAAAPVPDVPGDAASSISLASGASQQTHIDADDERAEDTASSSASEMSLEERKER